MSSWFLAYYCNVLSLRTRSVTNILFRLKSRPNNVFVFRRMMLRKVNQIWIIGSSTERSAHWTGCCWCFRSALHNTDNDTDEGTANAATNVAAVRLSACVQLQCYTSQTEQESSPCPSVHSHHHPRHHLHLQPQQQLLPASTPQTHLQANTHKYIHNYHHHF